MRNWNQYLKLWQQKRNELHIGSDMQADWSDMHHLLDEQMPVNGTSGSSDSGGNNLNTGGRLLNLAKFKLLYVAAGLIIGSIITYTVVRNIHEKTNKVHKQNKTETKKDSLAASAILKTDADSQNTNNDNAINDQKNDQNIPSAGLSSNSSADDNNATKGDRPTDGNVIKDNVKDVSAGDNASNSANKNSNRASSANSGGAANNGLPSSAIANHNAGSNIAANRNNIVSSSTMANSKSGKSTYRRSNRLRMHNRSRNLGNRRSNPTSDNNHRINSGNKPNITAGESQYVNGVSLINAATPPYTLTWNEVVANSAQTAANNLANTLTDPITRSATTSGRNLSANSATSKPGSNASKTTRKPGNGNLDWGLLAGTDGMGSLTPQSQNHNIYGSLPIDIYVGLFGTYNLNDRWAIGLQGRFLVPHTVSGHYNYSHVKTDTPKTTETIQISDSRKVYTVDVPIHLIYKVTPNINLKGGPILSIPVKTVNGTYPNAGNDSTGSGNSVTRSLNATAPAKKILFGVSAGIGFCYKFLWFDATYNYSPQPLKMKSDLGSYTSNTNSLQLTIGIKLNKSKK